MNCQDNYDKELHEPSIREIIGSLLDDKYAIGPRATDIQTLKAKLKVIYSPSISDIDSFIAKHHTKVHKELKKFKMEMTQFDKIDALEQALIPCGDYKDCITFFKLAYPNTSAPDRNFLQFAQNIREFEPDARVTAGSLQYSAASATSVTTTTADHSMATLQQQMLIMQQQIATLTSALTSHAAAAVSTAAMKSPTEYCW